MSEDEPLAVSRFEGRGFWQVAVGLLLVAQVSNAASECSAPCPGRSSTSLARRAKRRAPGSYTGVSAALGVGHDFGFLGGQLALPIVIGGGLTVGPFAAAGIVPALEEAEGHWAFAGGVLGYWGVRHRLMTEVSFAPLAVRMLELHGTLVATEPAYGPGVIVGYEFLAMSGFLVRAGGGAGVTLGQDSQVVPLLSVGVGWKW